MDIEPVHDAINVEKPNKLPVVLLCLGFVFLCMGACTLLINQPLVAWFLFLLGGLGVLYGSVKNPTVGFFLFAFLGWTSLGFYINTVILSLDFFDSPYLNRHYAQVIPVMLAVQLAGLGFAYFLFRRNKRSAGWGIILASIPYLIGFILHGGCAGPGFPFPLSFIPC